jgi:hypothetical protein
LQVAQPILVMLAVLMPVVEVVVPVELVETVLELIRGQTLEELGA